MAERLKIPPDKAVEYTIAQIEYLMEGYAENNKVEPDKKQLTGMDAIKQLQKMNGSF